MGQIIIYVAFILAGAGAGVALATTVMRKSLLKKGEVLLEEAREKAEVLKKERILQAKEKFLQLKAEHESVVNEKNSALQKAENRMQQKEQSYAQKMDEYQRKQRELQNQTQSLNSQLENLNKRQADLDKMHEEHVKQLELISGMSGSEAKEQLIESMRDEATAEAMTLIRDIVDEAKLTANTEAKKIVIETIQRTAAEHAIENTVTVFNIESDEIKGRIIGREGRNIRALEALTGVEIIIDDSPDAILLSGFDPVRREIARLSLHKLVTDGRIHPARIEEVVKKTEKQIEQEIPLLLRTKPVAALHRSGQPERHHGCRAWAEHQGGKTGRTVARYWQSG